MIKFKPTESQRHTSDPLITCSTAKPPPSGNDTAFHSQFDKVSKLCNYNVMSHTMFLVTHPFSSVTWWVEEEVHDEQLSAEGSSCKKFDWFCFMHRWGGPSPTMLEADFSWDGSTPTTHVLILNCTFIWGSKFVAHSLFELEKSMPESKNCH